MADLLSLAERCERAEGADRDLDAAIYETTDAAIDYQRIGIKWPYFIDRCHDGWVTVYGAKGEQDPFPEDLARYTASIDATMTLVLEEWEFTAGRTHDGKGIATVWSPNHDEWNEEAATPALALCAAALRAHAGGEAGR